MTVTDETTEAPTEDTTGEENETQDDSNSKRGRKRDQDFTKHRDFHVDLANYINSHPKYQEAALGELSPNQIKAVLLLRTDFANQPEQIAAREQKKAERAARNSKYEGLTEEQKKRVKAAEKAEREQAKLVKRAEEAAARAAQLRVEAQASGEDLAAVVAAQQNGAETTEAPEEQAEEPRRRGLGRRR